MSEWQPIATAPKDQTAVLLGYFRENFDGSIYQEGGEPVVARWIGGGWTTPRYRLNSEGLFSPTHWMPLPALPEVARTNPDFKTDFKTAQTGLEEIQ